jgi:phospholipid/cholesterol/gamma-HCH transport system substrate-binding protein
VGTAGRGRSLRSTLRTLGPTAAQMRRVTGLLAARRREIPRLVHNLRVITEATAGGDGDLERVVDAGNATLRALAENQEPLKATLSELPRTLAAARTTLDRTPAFATAMTQALRALQPSIRGARATLRATPGALEGVVPLPVAPAKQFIDAVAPLGPAVRSASADLDAATPPLKSAFGVLGRTANRLASAPKDGTQSSLFWLAWFAHNVNATLSTEDAHGAIARGLAMFTCSSAAPTGELGDVVGRLVGTTSFCSGGPAR